MTGIDCAVRHPENIQLQLGPSSSELGRPTGMWALMGQIDASLHKGMQGSGWAKQPVFGFDTLLQPQQAVAACCGLRPPKQKGGRAGVFLEVHRKQCNS